MWEGFTMEVLQRPGGELATRPIHFFWVVDCSGSMYGEKIGIVNNTIQECIPEMRSAADNNPNAQLLIRALQFSSGASWITSSPVPVEDYGWEDMDTNGLTELGKAFDLLAAQLSIPEFPKVPGSSDSEPLNLLRYPYQNHRKHDDVTASYSDLTALGSFQ